MSKKEESVQLSAETNEAIRLFRVARAGERQARKADRAARTARVKVPHSEVYEFVKRTGKIAECYED